MFKKDDIWPKKLCKFNFSLTYENWREKAVLEIFENLGCTHGERCAYLERGRVHTWRALCISWARRHFPGVQRREYRECGRGAFKMCGRVLRENMGSNSRARRVIGDSGEKKEIIFGEFKRDLEKIILNGLGVWYVIFLGDKPYFFSKIFRDKGHWTINWCTTPNDVQHNYLLKSLDTYLSIWN